MHSICVQYYAIYKSHPMFCSCLKAEDGLKLQTEFHFKTHDIISTTLQNKVMEALQTQHAFSLNFIEIDSHCRMASRWRRMGICLFCP